MNKQIEAAELQIDIMTVHDLAKYLRLSELKVYKLAREGSVPAIRLGKTWRFRKSLVDEWIRHETELALQDGK